MAKTQQTFTNTQDRPIYIYVEPWPECFELEPDDELTLIWDAPDNGDTIKIDFTNGRELFIWPNGNINDIKYLFNGEDAEDLSWTFKHHSEPARPR